MLRGRYPASQLIWAQPTPADAAVHLCLRAPRWVPPTSTGLPDHWLNLSVRAVPNHPGRPGGCTCPLLHRRFKASSTWGAWPPATWRFEAESGSLALRLAPSPTESPAVGSLPPAAPPATCLTGDYMAASFQAARLARFTGGSQDAKIAKAFLFNVSRPEYARTAPEMFRFSAMSPKWFIRSPTPPP